MELISWYSIGWHDGYEGWDYNPPVDPFFEEEYREGYWDGTYDWEDDVQ